MPRTDAGKKSWLRRALAVATIVSAIAAVVQLVPAFHEMFASRETAVAPSGDVIVQHGDGNVGKNTKGTVIINNQGAPSR